MHDIVIVHTKKDLLDIGSVSVYSFGGLSLFSSISFFFLFCLHRTEYIGTKNESNQINKEVLKKKPTHTTATQTHTHGYQRFKKVNWDYRGFL